MLPKLQQSHIATSLRRDNLTSQIQCISESIQAKTNSRPCSSSRTTSVTDRGRIVTPLKILTVPSAISRNSTCPKKNSPTPPTSPSINTPSPAQWLNMPRLMASGARAPALWRERKIFWSQFLNQELFRSEKCLLLSSGGTTTVEIYLSESTTRTLFLNLCGRWQCSLWITTTIYRFSWMEPD